MMGLGEGRLIDIDDLIARARSQRRRLERLRMRAAAEAFVSEAR